MQTTIEIKNINNEILYSYKTEYNSIKKTVEHAISSNICLKSSFLKQAYLYHSDLSGADLSDANLSGADLYSSNLSDANLFNANICNIHMYDTYLFGTNLINIKLNQDFINEAKKDFIFICRIFKNELLSLRKNLVEGKIDGQFYSGQCCCLIGNILKSSGESVDKIVKKLGRPLSSDNPSEKWFSFIRQGHTPENNFFSQKALEWLDEVLLE